MFKYAVQELQLSEAVAYSFILVARKAVEVPALEKAIRDEVISVSKASRISSLLSEANAAELIEFAGRHTYAEIDREVVRRNPKAARRDKVKPLSEDQAHIEMTVSKKTLEKLKRAHALEASRGRKDLGEVLDSVLDEYLKHKDPVVKADRVLNRKPRAELCVHRVNPSRRVGLTAEQKHQVMARDRGQCTHVDQSGSRCENDRWLHVHHIRPVNKGGGNEPSNLTTLCSFHHDLVHQLSLPIEGQVTWLRSPRASYTSRAGSKYYK
jgi:hypothetical protein